MKNNVNMREKIVTKVGTKWMFKFYFFFYIFFAIGFCMYTFKILSFVKEALTR